MPDSVNLSINFKRTITFVFKAACTELLRKYESLHKK